MDVRLANVLQSSKTSLPRHACLHRVREQQRGHAGWHTLGRKVIGLLACDAAAQHALDLPDGRLRDHQKGSTPQNCAHDGKGIESIAINLKLLAAAGILSGKDRWQPIVIRDEPRHEIAADQKNFPLSLRESTIDWMSQMSLSATGTGARSMTRNLGRLYSSQANASRAH